jgi:protein-tyrosine phosphatase
MDNTNRRSALLASALLAALAFSGCANRPVAQPVAAVAAPAAVAPASDDAKRLIALQGAHNVRTFAKLRGRHGAIPETSFVRAADLNQLTADDRATLAAAHVVLDVDLRTADEAAKAPDMLAADSRFKYVRISLLGTERIDMSSLPDTLGEGYVEWLSADQAQFREVFETIASQKDGAVLFHCTAGKDRTGMISATLLSLAGVPRNAIVHNYAISAHYLQPMMTGNSQLAEMAKSNPKLVGMMGSPPDAIEAFLDELDRKYGGAHAYLKTIGLNDAAIQSLLVRLGQSR